MAALQACQGGHHGFMLGFWRCAFTGSVIGF